jgi:drug/metabolite transporter (DMT)-like permease
MNLVLLLTYAGGMVGGQLLFKQVAESIHPGNPADVLVQILATPRFYLAILLYGLLTLYWVWLLGRISLSYAYPFVALSIAMVSIIGAVCWGETLTPLQIFGVVLILLGVICMGIRIKA